jgi:hypothetical protein
VLVLGHEFVDGAVGILAQPLEQVLDGRAVVPTS